MYMRAVIGCDGSKIEHLLRRDSIDHYQLRRIDCLMAVIKRLLRNGPIPASGFSYAMNRLARAYLVLDRSFTYWEVPNPYYCDAQLIGIVRLKDGALDYQANLEIARNRDAEFRKPKYKKMKRVQVDFLKSLFELTALTKQLSRSQK